MHILVTGGTGFIGRALCRALIARGDHVSVYSRRPETVTRLCGSGVNPLEALDQVDDIQTDAVVNLAGESIAGGLWTASRKQLLRDSRVGLTEELCSRLARAPHPPPVFISGSATGFYGNGADSPLTEDSDPASSDFAQQLCQDWEEAADLATYWGARVVKLRIGLVMGPGGGFLKPLRLPFSLGLGGRLGNGQQWMSWISLKDVVSVLLFALDHDSCRGPCNAVAPEPVTNAEFTRTLATQLHRPAILAVPAFALRLMFRDLSDLMLHGQRVLPAKLLATGFQFQHNTLDSALNAALE
ncbi:MAG: TIGR01777 family oxidoreductase [Proteobacteria bacterium]|nr:TIGR01777 family oxidoreductase [Pseudomonadota bacterium]